VAGCFLTDWTKQMEEQVGRRARRSDLGLLEGTRKLFLVLWEELLWIGETVLFWIL